ncbi:PID-CTERM protein-sorting domain-containing protein [Pedobacter immunditicola]|uniref:PID-CTERM protein-sorting domain-containing protein n=1 Tax=Pedobacter immunditicola TaxID=3133440 RepID=UPI0030B24FE3
MKALTFILIMMLLAMNTLAQDPGPGFPGGDPDEPVPIDGGMYLLMAAGIFYGLKTIKRRNP